jgi:hypothetical protein
MTVQPPTESFQIPPTVDLKQLVSTLNRYLKVIRDRLDKIEGMRGVTPQFHTAPDLQGNRIKNVGRSQVRKDALTRGEFDDFQQEVSMLEEQVRQLTKRLDAAGVT